MSGHAELVLIWEFPSDLYMRLGTMSSPCVDPATFLPHVVWGDAYTFGLLRMVDSKEHGIRPVRGSVSATASGQNSRCEGWSIARVSSGSAMP